MVICIVQARMSSKRLVGKMVRDIGGETLIERGYRLACEAFGKENVYIAIPSTLWSIARGCQWYEKGMPVWIYPGKEDDVLGRFHALASQLRITPDTIIHRWTPDDWRKDPEMCRRVANGETGIPVEIGGEAFTFAQLKEWHETVTDPFLREHIGKLITPNPVAPPDDGLPWSVDTEADLIAANNSLLCTETV
jgi:spore coat polysaccharide biosynthesis protein SpsF (cytidylyltransferase family)